MLKGVAAVVDARVSPRLPRVLSSVAYTKPAASALCVPSARLSACSVVESARRCWLAAFLQAGFVHRKVALSTPDRLLHEREHQQRVSGNKVAADEATAEMEGEAGARGSRQGRQDGARPGGAES